VITKKIYGRIINDGAFFFNKISARKPRDQRAFGMARNFFSQEKIFGKDLKIN
jgi:hypothetical protein